MQIEKTYRMFKHRRRMYAKISDDHEKLDRIENQMHHQALIARLVRIDEYTSDEDRFFTWKASKDTPRIERPKTGRSFGVLSYMLP